MKAKLITTTTLGMATAVANAQLRPTRQHFVVPPAEVARTVVTSFAARGIQISTDQIKLPVDVLATEEHPQMEVSTVNRIGQLSAAEPSQTSAGIKLKCKAAGTCLPFYAVVTWEGDQQPVISPTRTADKVAQLTVERTPSIIKTGAHLTLSMESDHARIQMAVVSLGNASLGQRIRVSTPDRKHFYMAEVLSAGAVKGIF